MHISNLACWSSYKRKAEVYHVPELVEGDYKARADSPQSFKGPDVNFDPDPLLNTSVQFSQRTAFAHWNTRHTSLEEFSWSTQGFLQNHKWLDVGLNARCGNILHASA